MGNAMKVAGWVVAVVAVVVAVILGGQVRSLKSQFDNQELQIAKVASLEEQIQETLAQVETLSKELAESQAVVAGLEEKPLDTSELLKTLASVPDKADKDPGDEEAEEEPDDEDAAREEKNKTRQEKMMRVQMGAIMDMAYATLYGELNLPQDVKDAVRELILDAATEQQTAVIEAMRSKEAIANDVTQKEDEAKARLREKLSQVLNAEELAAWEEYEVYADHYLYENLLEGQLTMLASGLTAENRGMTKKVMAEELVVHLEEFGNSDQLYTVNNFNNAQRMALRQGLARLVDVLDEDQYAQVEGFVGRAEAGFDAVSE